jgi:hypothetical protein
VPEDDIPINWCDYNDTNSWGDDYGGTAATWAGWAAEHAEAWHQEFGQWMWEDDGEAGGDDGDGEGAEEEADEAPVANPFEEYDGDEGYLSLLGL